MFIILMQGVGFLMDRLPLFLFFFGGALLVFCMWSMLWFGKNKKLQFDDYPVGFFSVVSIAVIASALLWYPFADATSSKGFAIIGVTAQIFMLVATTVFSGMVKIDTPTLSLRQSKILIIAGYALAFFGVFAIMAIASAFDFSDIRSAKNGILLIFSFGVIPWLTLLLALSGLLLSPDNNDDTPRGPKTRAQTSMRSAAADKEYARIKGKKPPKMIEFNPRDD